MKLEAGKRYLTRDGQVTGPLIQTPNYLHSYEGMVGEVSLSWLDNGKWLDECTEQRLDLVSEYLATGETTNDIVTKSGSHYVAEGNQVWKVEADGTRVLVFDDHSAAPDPYDEIGAQIARNQRLDIAATLGAGLLGKLNYVINTDRHDLFAKDALALADALIEAAKTPPTP